ncbi:Magnesium-transporting ATPase, P-type 1 [Serratia fonticola]|uniref:Magnesium-transporting ATPase, P-type 1 n=1 Tax=Serratia fonticola TaxID=47917 RepID=A0A4V6KKW0_SERFO|nr:Magnesium-transporting ATPase, P-type 1 [Serratia fonticola]
MGTNVVSGTALAIVIGTGSETYFGQLAQRVTSQDEQPNAFQGRYQQSKLAIDPLHVGDDANRVAH